MSSVKKVKPEIQQIYTHAYRWIRLNRNGQYRHIPGAIAAAMSFNFRPFIAALMSHDHRHREFGGWINPYREAEFWNLKHGGSSDSDLPF